MELSAEITKSLLAKVSQNGTTSIYDRFQSALVELRSALAEVKEEIETNPIVPILVQHYSKGKKSKKLEVSLSSEGYATFIVPTQTSNLPSYKELVKKAEDLGVDISNLGRSRTKILARLTKEKEETSSSGSLISDPYSDSVSEESFFGDQEFYEEVVEIPVDSSSNYFPTDEDEDFDSVFGEETSEPSMSAEPAPEHLPDDQLTPAQMLLRKVSQSEIESPTQEEISGYEENSGFEEGEFG